MCMRLATLISQRRRLISDTPRAQEQRERRNMKKLMIGLALVVCLLVLSCAPPAPTPTPVPMPTPTNSESASRIAELEAKIRELQAENQRLLTENRELSTENQRLAAENQGLSDNLAKVTSLVTSSIYTRTLSKLPNIQTDANELATFLQGLPDLPPLPPGLTVSQIDDAINKARYLRSLLERLPPPPPLIAPPGWYELDEMKDEFIRMTEWMEDLEDLPKFLRVAGDFDDLRSDMITYLRDVAITASNTKSVLEEVRNTAASE